MKVMGLSDRLKNRGYRLTTQRGVVLDVLAANQGRPMNIEDIFESAGARLPGIGIATVYRTLELFLELGIAHSVHLHEASQHYEINTGSHHHYMVCNACGSTTVLEACAVDTLEDVIRDQSDFLVTSHCMTLFGYCPACLPSG